MSTPSVVIRFPLEAAPRVEVDALGEEEFARLFDWIAAHPEFLALLDVAYSLEERKAA